MKQISDEEFKRFTSMCKAAGSESPKEWFPDYRQTKGEYWFNIAGEVLTNKNPYGKAFNYRKSTDLCKLASDRTILANKISAWLNDYGGGEIDLTIKPGGYVIYKDNINRWASIHLDYFYPGLIYMRKCDAEKLCGLINKGNFSV